jgi:hypothetical protein
LFHFNPPAPEVLNQFKELVDRRWGLKFTKRHAQFEMAIPLTAVIKFLREFVGKFYNICGMSSDSQ